MTKLQQQQQGFAVPQLVARQSPGEAHTGIRRPRGKKKRKKKGRWGPCCLPELGCLATYTGLYDLRQSVYGDGIHTTTNRYETSSQFFRPGIRSKQRRCLAMRGPERPDAQEWKPHPFLNKNWLVGSARLEHHLSRRSAGLAFSAPSLVNPHKISSPIQQPHLEHAV
jgi:hypothetical protein